MTTTVAARRTQPATGAVNPGPRASNASVLRRRRRPWPVLLGTLLVLAFSAGSVYLHQRADHTTQVLATAAPLSAGQVITEADLRVVSVVADPTLDLLAASREDQVVGATVALPLAAGTLLSAAQLGAPAYPQPGLAIVAVTVPHLPAGTVPGSHVQLVTSTTTAAGAGAPPPTGVVVAVTTTGGAGGSGGAVVSVQLASTVAASVVVADTVGLVLLPPTG